MNNEPRKIALIVGALEKYAPYLTYYKNLLDDSGIAYDVIQWDRKGEQVSEQENSYTYSKPTSNEYSALKKIKDNYYFCRFVRAVLKKNKYDKIVVFLITTAFYLQPFLKKYYERRYIFDIRDYSPFVNNSFTKRRIVSLLNYSSLNVISSRGFLRWLPVKERVVISHNVNVSTQNLNLVKKTIKYNTPLNVLTLGSIRDLKANSQVINSLANDSRFKIQFSGASPTATKLQEYSAANNVKNIDFTGQYSKEEENDIVEACDIINSMFSREIKSDTLMSNRLYHSVIHQKPLMVNAGSYQAEMVEKYHLGLVVYENDNIAERIIQYCHDFEYNTYFEGCNSFLSDVKKDYKVWLEKVKESLNIER